MNSIAINGFGCNEMKRLSDAFIDRELLEEVKSHVLQHIRYCNDCAAAIEEKLGLKRLIQTSVRNLAVPANLSRSVRARIQI